MELKLVDKKREAEIDQAAYVLSDEIWPICDKLEKAQLLASELMEEYFALYEKDDDYIVYAYDCNRLKAGIISDYLCSALHEIQALEQRAAKLA